MTLSQIVVYGILAVFAGAGGALISGLLQKPKTQAEAENLNAAASVSMSAEAREWARAFAARAETADQRSLAAEERAQSAEERVDEIEAALVECYGYVRKLRDLVREKGATPPPLPIRLEALWRATDH